MWTSPSHLQFSCGMKQLDKEQCRGEGVVMVYSSRLRSPQFLRCGRAQACIQGHAFWAPVLTSPDYRLQCGVVTRNNNFPPKLFIIYKERQNRLKGFFMYLIGSRRIEWRGWDEAGLGQYCLWEGCEPLLFQAAGSDSEEVTRLSKMLAFV